MPMEDESRKPSIASFPKHSGKYMSRMEVKSCDDNETFVVRLTYHTHEEATVSIEDKLLQSCKVDNTLEVEIVWSIDQTH